MWNNTSGLNDYGMGQTGGYLDSPGTGISPTQKGRTFRMKGIVPISVAGIAKALQPDNTLAIGQEKIEMVSVLGLITSVNMQSTVVTFKIDDMTATPLDVKQWVDQNGNMDVIMRPLIENCYVNITGTVRSTNGEIYLVANKVRSVVDLNELTTHLVDVIHSKLILERGIQSNASTTGASNSTFSNNSNAAVGGFGVDNINGLTQQQQTVLQSISTFPNDDGCGIDHLINVMRGTPRDTLKKILNFLSEEGHIYTTIDDDHFKATAAN